MSKRLPPYGTYIAQQPEPIVIVFCGKKAWSCAKDLHHDLPFTVCLPSNHSPSDFTWPVNGSHVYLVNTGGVTSAYIRNCILCFLSYGAELVTIPSTTQPLEFKRNATHG